MLQTFDRHAVMGTLQDSATLETTIPLAVASTANETAPTDAGAGDPLVFQAQDLLQGRREAWIQHGEWRYCLRLTLAGRLYLTK